jgi:hypothetical protein
MPILRVTPAKGPFEIAFARLLFTAAIFIACSPTHASVPHDDVKKNGLEGTWQKQAQKNQAQIEELLKSITELKNAKASQESSAAVQTLQTELTGLKSQVEQEGAANRGRARAMGQVRAGLDELRGELAVEIASLRAHPGVLPRPVETHHQWALEARLGGPHPPHPPSGHDLVELRAKVAALEDRMNSTQIASTDDAGEDADDPKSLIFIRASISALNSKADQISTKVDRMEKDRMEKEKEPKGASKIPEQIDQTTTKVQEINSRVEAIENAAKPPVELLDQKDVLAMIAEAITKHKFDFGSFGTEVDPVSRTKLAELTMAPGTTIDKSEFDAFEKSVSNSISALQKQVNQGMTMTAGIAEQKHAELRAELADKVAELDHDDRARLDGVMIKVEELADKLGAVDASDQGPRLSADHERVESLVENLAELNRKMDTLSAIDHQPFAPVDRESLGRLEEGFTVIAGETGQLSAAIALHDETLQSLDADLRAKLALLADKGTETSHAATEADQSKLTNIQLAMEASNARAAQIEQDFLKLGSTLPGRDEISSLLDVRLAGSQANAVAAFNALASNVNATVNMMSEINAKMVQELDDRCTAQLADAKATTTQEWTARAILIESQFQKDLDTLGASTPDRVGIEDLVDTRVSEHDKRIQAESRASFEAALRALKKDVEDRFDSHLEEGSTMVRTLDAKYEKELGGVKSLHASHVDRAKVLEEKLVEVSQNATLAEQWSAQLTTLGAELRDRATSLEQKFENVGSSMKADLAASLASEISSTVNLATGSMEDQCVATVASSRADFTKQLDESKAAMRQEWDTRAILIEQDVVKVGLSIPIYLDAYLDQVETGKLVDERLTESRQHVEAALTVIFKDIDGRVASGSDAASTMIRALDAKYEKELGDVKRSHAANIKRATSVLEGKIGEVSQKATLSIEKSAQLADIGTELQTRAALLEQISMEHDTQSRSMSIEMNTIATVANEVQSKLKLVTEQLNVVEGRCEALVESSNHDLWFKVGHEVASLGAKISETETKSTDNIVELSQLKQEISERLREIKSSIVTLEELVPEHKLALSEAGRNVAAHGDALVTLKTSHAMQTLQVKEITAATNELGATARQQATQLEFFATSWASSVTRRDGLAATVGELSQQVVSLLADVDAMAQEFGRLGQRQQPGAPSKGGGWSGWLVAGGDAASAAEAHVQVEHQVVFLPSERNT